MKKQSILTGLLVSGIAISMQSFAADAIGGTGHYTLFNPVPKDQMRPFFTDQTVFTLTPFTVDAGHSQAEADLVDYIYDRTKVPGGAVRTEGWVYGWSTYKVGLCNRADFEVSIKAYSDIVATDSSAGTRTHTTGYGDTSLSSKINLWGNDGGKTALALFPYIDIPTAKGNRDWTGGLRLPFQVSLTDKLDLGLMTGAGFYENARNRLHASFDNGICLRAKVTDKIRANAEIFTTVGEETGDWSSFANVSGGYQLTRDLQLHVGFTFNIRRETDYNPFVGFTWRF